jgi:hypothetical protein
MSDVKPPSSPKIFEVDREGEAPANIAGSPYPSQAIQLPTEISDPAPAGLQTPEAIVVKRVKKKVRVSSVQQQLSDIAYRLARRRRLVYHCEGLNVI